MSFDFQPTLHGEGITARPMQAQDRVALRNAASDPLIWAGHPATTRHLPEVFDPYFDLLLGTTRALIVEDATGRVIGTSSFYSAPDGREALSVGFTFLTRDHWGGNTNRILKGLMFAHIFKQHDAVWLHIGPDNIRSQTATLRLGAEFVEDAMLDLGTGPHMVKCYRLTRSTWAASEATSS